MTATSLPAGVIKLTVDGGTGEDTVLGSQGADNVLGGDGNDFLFGDNGNDVALMGANDDVFQWNPGDGNDIARGSGRCRLDAVLRSQHRRERQRLRQRRPRAVRP